MGGDAVLRGNALELITHWRTAQTESRLAIRFFRAKDITATYRPLWYFWDLPLARLRRRKNPCAPSCSRRPVTSGEPPVARSHAA